MNHYWKMGFKLKFTVCFYFLSSFLNWRFSQSPEKKCETRLEEGIGTVSVRSLWPWGFEGYGYSASVCFLSFNSKLFFGFSSSFQPCRNCHTLILKWMSCWFCADNWIDVVGACVTMIRRITNMVRSCPPTSITWTCCIKCIEVLKYPLNHIPYTQWLWTAKLNEWIF